LEESSTQSFLELDPEQECAWGYGANMESRDSESEWKCMGAYRY
jgi:hypothetical protein